MDEHIAGQFIIHLNLGHGKLWEAEKGQLNTSSRVRPGGLCWLVGVSQGSRRRRRVNGRDGRDSLPHDMEQLLDG